MKKLLLALCLVSGFTYADDSAKQNLSATIEYTKSKIEFDAGGTFKPDGFSIGFSTPSGKSGVWGKFEYATDNKTNSDLYGGSIGGHLNLLAKNNFYLNGFSGVGYTRIESGITKSNLSFITIPIGIEAGYIVSRNIDVFTNIGYKWMFDLTGSDGYFGNNAGSNPNAGKTLCNDGTWSDSTGSGTCSWHDGVAENQPTYNTSSNGKISLGDAENTLYGVGLRFKF